jgi:hypothetical protein
MRINRPMRRSSRLPLACGCLATFAILFIIVLGAGFLFLPQIIGAVTGLTPRGDTAAVFAGVTPPPTVELQNPTALPQITVDLGQFGEQTLNSNPQLYNFTVGTGAGGQQTAVARFTEAGLMDLCHQRSTICSPSSTDPRFRNARIDLRPGGAIIYLDTMLPQLGGVPLPAGVVVRWDAPTRRVAVSGVDIGGQLYSADQQSLRELVTTVEQQMNDLVQRLTVEMGVGVYSVSDVVIDDNNLTVILR